MAKHIDLTNKFDNEKPSITIGDKTFTINDEKTNVLIMNQVLKNGALNETEMIDKVIEILLGKKNAEALDKMKLRFNDYKTVFFAIMAAINDEDIEDVEKRFQEQ